MKSESNFSFVKNEIKYYQKIREFNFSIGHEKRYYPYLI